MSSVPLGEAFEFNPKVTLRKGTVAPRVEMADIRVFTRTVHASGRLPYTGGAKFDDGDVLMARITPSLENGKTSIYRASLNERSETASGSTEFIVVRGRQGVSTSEFAYYVLASPEVREFAIATMTGSSGRQRVQTDSLKAYEIELPSLREQDAIVNVLSTFDDKIESNRRTIRLLDDLSGAIFAEWKSKRHSHQDTTFGEFVDVFGGTTPSTKDEKMWNGDVVWVTPGEITQMQSLHLFDSERRITEQALTKRTQKLHEPGSIFMTSRATIGAFAVNEVPAATNQGFIVVCPPRDKDFHFVLREMMSRKQEFIDNANGSTFLEISRGRFKELPIELPEEWERNELHERLDPLWQRSRSLESEVRQLTQIRAILQPELLTGAVVPGRIAAVVEQVAGDVDEQL